MTFNETHGFNSKKQGYGITHDRRDARIDVIDGLCAQQSLVA